MRNFPGFQRIFNGAPALQAFGVGVQYGPLDIFGVNCEGLFDLASTSLLQSDQATACNADNQTVGRWVDTSSAANNLDFGGAGNHPNYRTGSNGINTIAAPQWDGAHSDLITPNPWTWQKFHLAFLYADTNGAPAVGSYFLIDFNSAVKLIVQAAGKLETKLINGASVSDNIYLLDGTGGTSATGSINLYDGSIHLVEWEYNLTHASHKLWIDRVLQTPQSSPSTADPGVLGTGRVIWGAQGTDTNVVKGTFGPIVKVKRAITALEQADLQDWFFAYAQMWSSL